MRWRGGGGGGGANGKERERKRGGSLNRQYRNLFSSMLKLGD